MRRLARRSVAVAGIFLLGLAGVLTFAIFVRTLDFTYAVEVQAPSNLNWTLWIPHADLPVAPSRTGAIRSITVMDLANGTVDNVTGRGSVSLRASWSAVAWPGGATVAPPKAPLGIDVWRNSSDASARIWFTGGTTWTVRPLGFFPALCGGGGASYAADLAEGWGRAERPIIDCIGALNTTGGLAAGAIASLGAGAVVLWASTRRD